MKVFILEDSPHRMALFREVFFLGKHEVFHAASVDEGKKLFTQHFPFELVLLDHDLGDENNTGLTFCRWLVEEFRGIGTAKLWTSCFIHSYNLDGAILMEGAIDGVRPHLCCIHCAVTRIPFGPRLLDILKDYATRAPDVALPSPAGDPQAPPPA